MEDALTTPAAANPPAASRADRLRPLALQDPANDALRGELFDALLAEGRAEEAAALVRQGQIGELISAKPEARRAILEEAAGILKHRRRKEKALRKLARHEGGAIGFIEEIDAIARGAALARQPQRHRDAHLKLSCALVAVEAVGLVCELQGSRFRRPSLSGILLRACCITSRLCCSPVQSQRAADHGRPALALAADFLVLDRIFVGEAHALVTGERGGLDLVDLSPYPAAPEVDETGDTFEANARLKATALAPAATSMPCAWPRTAGEDFLST